MYRLSASITGGCRCIATSAGPMSFSRKALNVDEGRARARITDFDYDLFSAAAGLYM